jgi:phage/plasmid-associated DNA primase
MAGEGGHQPPHERDKKLREKLFACAPGILNRVIEGCLEWQRDGLKVPDCLKAFTEKFRADQNVLAHFIEDEAVLGDHLTTQKTPTYMRYQSSAKDHGEFVVTSTEFAKLLCMLAEGKSGSKVKRKTLERLRHIFEADLAEGGCRLTTLRMPFSRRRACGYSAPSIA